MTVYVLIESDILGDYIISIHTSEKQAKHELEEIVQKLYYNRHDLRIEQHEVIK